MRVLSFLSQNTRLGCLRVWILLSGSFFVFSSLAKIQKETDTAITEQTEILIFFQLARLCSQIVFLIFGRVENIFAENLKTQYK